VQKWDNKGSKTVRESNTQSCAPLITKKLLRRLEVFEKDKRKFVIFAHYFDPHGRYMNHPKVKIFAKKGLSNRYDSEIAFVDHHLKPVLEKLNEGLLAKNTIVVITSDHGEAFREHGFNFHGRTVYDEEIKVPLLIRIPGIPGKRLKKPAGLVDLLPTLTELTGLKAARAQGESLVGLWTGRDPQPTGPIFMEQLPYPNYKTHIVAALSRQTRVKAIRNITDNVIEVFDLKSDPREKINLLDKNPNAGRKIRQQLEQFIDADPG